MEARAIRIRDNQEIPSTRKDLFTRKDLSYYTVQAWKHKKACDYFRALNTKKFVPNSRFNFKSSRLSSKLRSSHASDDLLIGYIVSELGILNGLTCLDVLDPSSLDPRENEEDQESKDFSLPEKQILMNSDTKESFLTANSSEITIPPYIRHKGCLKSSRLMTQADSNAVLSLNDASFGNNDYMKQSSHYERNCLNSLTDGVPTIRIDLRKFLKK